MSGISATVAPVPPVAYGVSTGGGWVYLQPMQIGLSPSKLDHYLHRQSLGLGVAQIVLGSLCIIFNLVSLILENGYYYYGLGIVGHGFWCGVLFIITGAFGISAAVSKTKCKIVSYMVLCIISACFTAGLLICGIIGAAMSGGYNPCNDYGYSTSYRYYYRPPCSTAVGVTAMEGGMAASAFIAAILFIWGSTLGCKARKCCCNPNLVQQVLLPPNYASNNGLQMIQSSHFVLPTMPYQPVVPPAYQPSLVQALWTQPQLMQGTAAAATADPYSTQAFGQSSVEKDRQPAPKF